VATGCLVVGVGGRLAVGEDLDGAVGINVVEPWVRVVPVVLAPEFCPGCSLATTTPISEVAAVAARTAERVRRRIRASARSRDSGDLSSVGRRSTPQAYGVGVTPA
jgi:hypothetical protein